MKKLDEQELWENVQYRMENEGFHYCFKYYHNWKEIEDEEFQKLREEYLKSAELLEQYVNNKVNTFYE
jgi:hypothetical protein